MKNNFQIKILLISILKKGGGKYEKNCRTG